MTEDIKRPLKVFLCHASGDKPAVRDLYRRLAAEGVDAWLDQEKLLPGQNWRLEIPRAVREADVVVICLSNKSITKEGYVQREIKFALDVAGEKPEGTIFLIPARLEDCVVPEPLDGWQWVDLFEEHGFLRLLRSLKLRAARIGAVIEPPADENDDQEIDRRLDQLYTEGLAAFYTEDWDRASQRFQAILRDQPNHKNAAEKLAQAERQRSLAKLYTQATEAYQSENWPVAIQALEDLRGKSEDYKGSVQLLADAKKQYQLKELYAEAKRLHTAQKWQAVVKVFEQISIIEPTYADPEGLLISAQREAAELKRLADLNELYRQGVHKMDAGEWYKARNILEQVHNAQIGFLETEHLLRKVEAEIIKLEELNKRNNQINTLYEQAHGLMRSNNWRDALDKIEEIQKLDSHFEDKEEIAKRAKAKIELDEREAQKQNQLAVMYADAVKLLREGKYQEALDKWQEVRAIDPEYPDRQLVEKSAHKKSTLSTKPGRKKRSNLANDKSTKTHLAQNYEISVAYPQKLSKRFESTFLVHLYLPQYRAQINKNIKLEFPDQKPNELVKTSNKIAAAQKIKVKFSSPKFTFTEPVIRTIDSQVNRLTLLGMPNDDCEPGSHRIRVALLNSSSEEEIDSMTIGVKVVDFAFDHISRPLFSRAISLALGIGSFSMFVLTFLEQIDKTVGLTSGTAAGVAAAIIYANFYTLFQRVRLNSP